MGGNDKKDRGKGETRKSVRGKGGNNKKDEEKWEKVGKSERGKGGGGG